MFLYRVKINELDAARMLSLKQDIANSEMQLRAQCPFLEMSLVGEAGKALDVYLALEDFIDSTQLRKLANELNALIDSNPRPHVQSELIHI
jgi:hypothetical protein